jgi:hypothetical protein
MAAPSNGSSSLPECFGSLTSSIFLVYRLSSSLLIRTVVIKQTCTLLELNEPEQRDRRRRPVHNEFQKQSRLNLTHSEIPLLPLVTDNGS